MGGRNSSHARGEPQRPQGNTEYAAARTVQQRQVTAQRPIPPQQALGIRYTVPSPPCDVNLKFACSECGAECFDGNVPKKLTCVCRAVVLRSEDGQVSVLPGPLSAPSFNDCFSVRLQYPPSGNPPVLETLTLGVFETSLQRFRVNATGVAWERVMNEVLIPFFAGKTRCVGINDLLAVGGVQFKVMAAFPMYGVVGTGTSLQCYQALAAHNLRKVQVAVMTPKRLTQREFEGFVLPYFKTHILTHLHQDQYIYVPELPFIVIAADPPSGLITRETEIFFEQRPVEPSEELVVQVDTTALPPPFAIVPPQSLQMLLTEHVLRPYFEGCFRAVYQGKDLSFAQMQFRVVEHRQPLGYVTPDTRLRLVEAGQYQQMARVGQRMVFRTTLSDGRVVLVEDPRIQLLQQLMQLSQMLEASGLHGASDSTHQDVLSALPTRQMTAIPQDSDASKCLICLSDYEVGEEVTTLPCFHFFHSECIREWLGRSQLCPMCKINIEESLAGN